jgi:quinohemoprotein ethanol dehydrogenase
VLNDAEVKAGEALFHSFGCNGCHGGGLQSAGAPAPDLRESGIAMDKDALWQVLHDGALLSKGMPQFGFFTRQQVDQIHTYIRWGARAEIRRQKTGIAPPPPAVSGGMR